MPFYAWLRQMAWSRLAELHRQNVDDPHKAELRQGQVTPKCLSEMVRCFGPDSNHKTAAESGVKKQPSEPSEQSAAVRRQAKTRVSLALCKLDPAARELLLLYYVEQLTVPEIACVLAIDAAQVKLRHVKAIRK